MEKHYVFILFFPRLLLLTCAGEQDRGRRVLWSEPALTIHIFPHKISTTGNWYEELSPQKWQCVLMYASSSCYQEDRCA